MPRQLEDCKPLRIAPTWQTTDNKTARIYQGDVRHVLDRLPPQSVQCVVTSPPYWGLRDYKTGTWEGGDTSCDHIRVWNLKRSNSGGLKPYPGDNRAGPSKERGTTGHTLSSAIQYRDVCKKCGAQRIDHQLGSEALHDCLGWARGVNCAEEDWANGCHVCRMVMVCRGIRRVLRGDGTFWLNYGDSYTSGGRATFRSAASTNKGHHVQNGLARPNAGLPNGNLVGIPWRVALALQADGWILRQEIIWAKPNPMPDSVKNRCTKAHEQIFLFTKSTDYYYDNEAIKEEDKGRPAGNKNAFMNYNKTRIDNSNMSGGLNVKAWEPGTGANKRSVWTVPTFSYPGAHYATFPPKLIEPCVLAGTSAHGCCPDCGAAWERVTESIGTNKSDENGIKEMERQGVPRTTANLYKTKDRGTTVTLGWQPRCSCRNPKVIPCTILDPFLGSGTTIEVAIKHKRYGVGIELSEKYIAKNAIPRVCKAITKYRPTKLHLIPDDD